MKIFTVYSEQDLGSERAFSTLEAAWSYLRQVTPAGKEPPEIVMHIIRDDMSPSEVAANIFNRASYSKYAGVGIQDVEEILGGRWRHG